MQKKEGVMVYQINQPQKQYYKVASTLLLLSL